jgi:hypothetical protein
MAVVTKSREVQVRRVAARRGYRLMKSPRRDKLAFDFGRYLLVDAFRDRVVYGDQPFRFSATLDEITNFLDDPVRNFGR